ncbi:Pyrokinin-1 receptor [Araneus ventricosus]|uniref:Pyrokinin-1 receptor n=1 Tax=Araneus ventricosus TaxID=182803 RepID=A0A4Y2UR02_ARAVE|nr:Pyrokinin-1 receptor [Araneus ventricosus]
MNLSCSVGYSGVKRNTEFVRGIREEDEVKKEKESFLPYVQLLNCLQAREIGCVFAFNQWISSTSGSESLLVTMEECGLRLQRDPLSTIIPMTLAHSLILMTGITGNICTCIVIARNRYMHIATNYYLFSLAISDLLLLILGLPQELYQLWYKYPYIFGESVCILRGLTSEMSTNASILTITAFTVERYVAICHPFRAQAMSHLPRAVKTIPCIWITAALCALPALQLGIRYEIDDNGRTLWKTALCDIINPFPHIFETSTGLFFVLPIILISVLYVYIGIRLRQASIDSQNESINDCNHLSKTNMNSRKAVVKLLSK